MLPQLLVLSHCIAAAPPQRLTADMCPFMPDRLPDVLGPGAADGLVPLAPALMDVPVAPADALAMLQPALAAHEPARAFAQDLAARWSEGCALALQNEVHVAALIWAIVVAGLLLGERPR